MSAAIDPLALASDAQQRATTPGHSAWVEANAGTGKTKVLTDRVTRLLLDSVKPERILCLTFTKAAAAEMRNRLATQLGRWALADQAKLDEEVAQLIDRPPNAAERVAARRLFARVLDAPGGINILTIHAFCQALLKRFPLEAGVAPGVIAVIAPYAAQVRLLRERLALPGLEIDSVDGFQGREKEAVVISLVRSNSEGEIGFLANTRRMNVALTRARRFLLVVADSATLGGHPYYAAFFAYVAEIDAHGSARSDDAPPIE